MTKKQIRKYHPCIQKYLRNSWGGFIKSITDFEIYKTFKFNNIYVYKIRYHYSSKGWWIEYVINHPEFDYIAIEENDGGDIHELQVPEEKVKLRCLQAVNNRL